MESEFLSLSTKFLFLSADMGDRKTSELESNINSLLNNLCSLDYKNQTFQDTKLATQLLQSFSHISPKSDTIVVKACWLIKTLVLKQKIQLQSNVLSTLIAWIINCIQQSFYSVLCDALDTLSVLLRMDSVVTAKFYDDLITAEGLLLQLLKNPYFKKPDESYETSAQEEILISTVSCVEAILSAFDDDANVSPGLAGSSVLKMVYKVELSKLNEKLYCTLMTSALSCLRHCCDLDAEWSAEHLGEMLGLAKFSMMPGSHLQASRPQKLMKAQQGVPEPRQIPTNRGGKMARTRKPRTTHKSKAVDKKKSADSTKKDNEEVHQFKMPYSEASIQLSECQPTLGVVPYRTSESDFSESEANRVKIDRQRQSKLRQTALALICTIAQRVEKRQIFGYWHSLFPYEQVTPTTPSLLNCVCHDPSPRCRMVAVQATAFLLFKSKPYLVQAEMERVATTFTPFSVALGNMIYHMYAALTQALANEGDFSVLTQILKCLTVFIQATPFHHLRPGLVTKFVVYVRRLVWNKDPTIRVGALMVMGYLLSVDVMTPEILDCVGSKTATKFDRVEATNHDDDEEMLESDDEQELGQVVGAECDEKVQISWLLQTALEHLGVQVSANKKPPGMVVTPLRIECLQVLFAMSSHFHLLQDHLSHVAEALKNGFADTSFDVNLYAGRVLDALGHTMANYLLLHKGDNPTGNNNDIVMNACLKFWLDLIPDVTQAIQNDVNSATLRTVCCDALANIGAEVFERLPHDRSMLLISLLSGCACDEDSLVRASAIRASAVFVLFPSLREDMCYIENITDSTLRLVKDKAVLARIKASWSLGNITDALIFHNGTSAIDRTLLKRVIETNIEAAADSDKIKCNAMRTLGNCCRLMTSNLIQDPVFNQLTLQAIEKLVQNILTGNNVKVKWNACYAIGNLMRNPILFGDGFRSKWQDLVFPALCKITVHSPNFKVRTNAAAALIVLQERRDYGCHFESIWSALLTALEASDNLHDFNEYNHRDNLQEQLCVALSHFIELASVEDLVILANLLLPHVDATKQNWRRVTNTNRLLPERAERMLAACKRLSEAEHRITGDSVKKAAVASLMSCFGALEE